MAVMRAPAAAPTCGERACSDHRQAIEMTGLLFILTNVGYAGLQPAQRHGLSSVDMPTIGIAAALLIASDEDESAGPEPVRAQLGGLWAWSLGTLSPEPRRGRCRLPARICWAGSPARC